MITNDEILNKSLSNFSASDLCELTVKHSSNQFPEKD